MNKFNEPRSKIFGLFLLKKFFITKVKKLMKNKKREEKDLLEAIFTLLSKCDINLLPYKFDRYSKSCICSHLLPPFFSSIFLPCIYLMIQIIIILFLLIFSRCACASKTSGGQKKVKMC